MAHEQHICIRAAQLLEEFGWCQGRAKSQGAMCMLGAMGAAASSLQAPGDPIAPSTHLCAAKALVRGRLSETELPTGQGLHVWNDHLSRTMAEVTSLLRRAGEGAL